MDSAAEPEHLKRVQYRDASRLEARIALHRRFSVNPQGWPQWLFEQLAQLALPPDARILELGCGQAALWTENAGAIPSGWRIRLSDFSHGMLAEAEQRVAGASHPFAFEVIDAQAIPHPASRFDCVIANHMLYHVPNRHRALREIRRVLRPGGWLFASTLSGDTLLEMADLARTVAGRDVLAERVAAGFLLDNGEEQLRPFFPHVETRRYVDALEITDAEPLLAYYRSMILDEPFSEAELERIRENVSQQIERDGAFAVRKNSGVFLAQAAKRLEDVPSASD